MSNFRPIDRQTGFLLPPSVDDWLSEKHLARFVVELIDGLDLSAMSGAYRGSGSASYHPRLLLGILVYGYATGVFSSRKLERATYDSVAFRFVAANDHPDHDTIATFRRRFLKEIEGLFVQLLLLAREMGLLKMGTVALDGTKIHANTGWPVCAAASASPGPMSSSRSTSHEGPTRSRASPPSWLPWPSGTSQAGCGRVSPNAWTTGSDSARRSRPAVSLSSLPAPTSSCSRHRRGPLGKTRRP
jgi:transposase